MKILIYILIAIGILVGGYFVYHDYFKPKYIEIKSAGSFDECVAQNNIVQEIYPPVCIDKSGKSFTQDIGYELEKNDLIKVDIPRPNTLVSSPLEITGQARGKWYFEASFPIKLYDENNQIIAEGIAQAQGNWMTDDFVPFKATLNFTIPSTQKGKLVLQKDNPSGQKELDDSLIVPVTFY